MTTLHPTTVALLEAAEAWTTTATVLEAVGRWRDAGRPDLTTPTPDRLTELEARLIRERLRTLEVSVAELRDGHAARANQLDRVANRVAVLTGKADFSPSNPPRFVPTEPGWYWLKGGDRIREVVLLNGELLCLGSPVWDFDWLAPVAPYAPQPTRTEEEARAKPMRGDRWKCNSGIYTITKPRPDETNVWFGCWQGEPETSWFAPGFPDETYLGNFAHELEEP